MGDNGVSTKQYMEEAMYEFDTEYGDECFDVNSLVSQIEAEEEVLESLEETLELI